MSYTLHLPATRSCYLLPRLSRRKSLRTGRTWLEFRWLRFGVNLGLTFSAGLIPKHMTYSITAL